MIPFLFARSFKHWLRFFALLAAILPSFVHAQSRCDTLQTCLGNVLTITQSGQAQYVDIQQTPAQRSLSTALSFEAWINPQRIPNTRQFIAGLWGPNTDANDVWVLYLSPQDELVFEINGSATSLGAMDNTIARTPFAMRYGTWTHVTAVFDGASQTATLFLNGMQVAQNRNASFPANRLRNLQTPTLLMQLGSTNALGNLGEQNATFRGQMDEIRLWSKVLTQSEILCGLYSALRGNEQNLLMYFRCNDLSTSTRLCDATANNTIADMRSGARCQAPSQNRVIPPFFTAQPQSITDAFQCDQTRTYQIRIRNIAAGCSERVALSLSGAQAGEFRITPNRFTLPVGAETIATLTLNTQLTGSIQASLNIARENLCGDTLRTALNLTRTTTLQPSEPSVTFGTLYAGCREVPFAERTITLRNAGTQPLQLLGFRQSRAQIFRLIGTTLQQTLAGGASTQVTMRFFPADTANTYFDTLRIRTGDPCQPELALPLAGTIEEAVIIRRGFGLTRLDSVAFGRECPQSGITDPFEFTWESAVRGTDVRIDTVIAPAFMRVRSLRYPVLLRSGTFAEPNFLRFAPLQPGFVRDSVIIRASIPGGLPSGMQGAGLCTFEKKIYVSGRGNATEVRITPSSVNFGNVIVGQQGSSTARLSNPSTEDTLRILVFLRRGDNFFLTGARSFTLAPGASVNVPLTFRPNADSTYTDDLCISEQRCFFTTCATLTGRGVQSVFRFDSVLTRIDGVLGCASRFDTLTIFNTSNTDQTLTNISFTDQSGGRIEILSGLNSANVISTVIPARGSLTVQIRYTPNDLMQDRTDAAFINFRAAGQDWTLSIRATSVAPKLFITPLTAFGVVEIGDRRLDTILVENISQVPVQLSSLMLPDGYTLHWNERALPYTLQPREVVRFGVTFAPTEDRRYDGTVTANSLMPCPTVVSGRFQGRGERADLELGANPVNIGFTRPCECRTAITTLFNSSFANSFTVQSAVIAASDNDPLFSKPEFFTWASRFSPNGTVPYQIPPQGIDTITIRFCPRSTAIAQNVLNAATMRITAQSPAKQQTFTVDLTGRRTLVFTPSPSALSFTPTLVGTDAAPLTVNLSIPTGASQNPSPQAVVIDSIGFLSADGFSTSPAAFRLLSPTGSVNIQPNQAAVPIRIGFRPTEARPYAVRLVLYQSQPCRDIDTTVAINGIGFVGALGLPFRFNNTAIRLDTFRLTTCGTLSVPIFSARTLSDSLNIRLRLAFDTTKIRAISAASDFAMPNRVTMRSTSGGIELRLSGVRLDSIRALFRVEFISLTQRRASFSMTIDSLEVRTSQGGTFALVPAGTFAQTIIQETRIEAPLIPAPTVQFDSVQILGCSARTLQVRNTGDVAVRAFSLVNLPPEVRILSATPPLTDSVRAGQSLTLTLEYCPRSERRIDTLLGIRAETPCSSVTQATVAGRGFRPDFPIVFSFTSASLRGTIGDTLTLPLVIDRDIATTVNNTRFWLRNFRFAVNLAYSPYSLKYIGASTPLCGAMLTAQNSFPMNAPLRGALALNFSNVDSLRAGTIALLRFVVAVPDTLITPMLLSADSASFRTDSLMFLRIRPISTMATWTTDGICNITFLRAPGAASGGNVLTKTTTQLFASYPNPASERVTLEFELTEARPVHLGLYDITGNAVETLLSGQILAPGRYAVEADIRNYGQGVYVWRLYDGTSIQGRSAVIVR